MCSVTEVAQAFVFVTDTYKQLTRHITYSCRNQKSAKEKNILYT